MKLIGQGAFSKVYQLSNKQVLIKSSCNAKEAISMDWHTSKGIFPKLDRIDYQEYTCELYTKVKSLKNELNADQYEIYKNLRGLDIPLYNNKYDGLAILREVFKKQIKNVRFRKALIEMLDILSNYGTDIRFEISPRNVAVKNDKLILLDVFFFQSQLEDVRSSKR